ncbi:type II toxin-antitoxin system death-on-curing family toxin [Frankia sp. ACN1ag]|uniref:type II toxin-antitoxin system death-on-curing family toxin n=1 Tax=Frankia sp. ACN1ag TaxID=102891 RepID=UPI0006DCA6CE|nr:Fic family protein [Frankia sp. ACN1ag]KQC34915.1 alcohol dehydrogenase [Frankia sp. ACN1ag]
MSAVEYLDLEDLLALVRVIGAGPVRDVGLLDAAAARASSSAFGQDAYPSPALKAAALLHSVARSHRLVDGNKRLAWLAAVVFLDINGCTTDLVDDKAFELVMDAEQGIADVEKIADRLCVVPADRD